MNFTKGSNNRDQISEENFDISVATENAARN